MAGDSQFEQIFPKLHVEPGLLNPIGRSGHCVVADETNMYVYGGYNPGPGVPEADNTQVNKKLL